MILQRMCQPLACCVLQDAQQANPSEGSQNVQGRKDRYEVAVEFFGKDAHSQGEEQNPASQHCEVARGLRTGGG